MATSPNSLLAVSIAGVILRWTSSECFGKVIFSYVPRCAARWITTLNITTKKVSSSWTARMRSFIGFMMRFPREVGGSDRDGRLQVVDISTIEQTERLCIRIRWDCSFFKDLDQHHQADLISPPQSSKHSPSVVSVCHHALQAFPCSARGRLALSCSWRACQRQRPLPRQQEILH